MCAGQTLIPRRPPRPPHPPLAGPPFHFSLQLGQRHRKRWWRFSSKRFCRSSSSSRDDVVDGPSRLPHGRTDQRMYGQIDRGPNTRFILPFFPSYPSGHAQGKASSPRLGCCGSTEQVSLNFVELLFTRRRRVSGPSPVALVPGGWYVHGVFRWWVLPTGALLLLPPPLLLLLLLWLVRWLLQPAARVGDERPSR